LLAYITYFIVTVIIHFVQRVANLAAAGVLVVGLDSRLPARYARRKYNNSGSCVFTEDPTGEAYSSLHWARLLLGWVTVC